MTYSLIVATIEEFEQGTWVADLESQTSFDGSFQLLDGSQWAGTKVDERFEPYRYFTRVVGGAGKLGATLQDKYYSGNVSLQVAVGDVCQESGESLGTVTSGLFLSTYMRLQGSTTSALNAIAKAFGQIWWIGRDGKVNMAVKRPTGPDCSGGRISADTDASIVLAAPTGVLLGVGYDSTGTAAKMEQVRHVRWSLTQQHLRAQLYAVPFLFRDPAVTAYSCLYSALVDTDHGDGTIDVIADGRFGVTRVPLLCGVPGSKVTMMGGDQVTLGFLGGDPQKPFAVAMGQLETATKQVARNGDSVSVTFTTADAALILAPPGTSGGPCSAAGNITVTGTITSGTSRISVGD